MEPIFSLLETHQIPYKKFEHEAVFTCEESERLPPMPGCPTKNLFLRDRKGDRHFLVVIGHEKSADLKALSGLIGADKLSFASEERLKEFLGVEPGSVTMLGLMCDTEHRVEVVIDAAVWAADEVQSHPLRNTGTVVLSHEGVEQFLAITGHKPLILDIPARA